MIEKSYTRITLSLDILRKIEDGECKGYHELGIIKHQIDLHDTITIEDASSTTLECDHPDVPCDNRNICWKAVEFLNAHFGTDRKVRIQIEKKIPVMGGLAGGSANAATTLSILNRLWNLNLSTAQLINFGRKLGMDVPFYFVGRTAFDSEATGQLRSIQTGIDFAFILAIPDFGVSTKEAYQGIDYSSIGKFTAATEQMIAKLLQNVRDEVYPLMHNDFENTVFKQHPRLAELKRKLIDAGCRNAVLSGSGSTILGIVDNRRQAESIQQKIDCKSIIAATLKI